MNNWYKIIKELSNKNIKIAENIPEEFNNLKYIDSLPTVAKDHMYVHCVPLEVNEVEAIINNNGGYPMNSMELVSLHDEDAELLKDYYALFVGCNEEWAAILGRDYDYQGHYSKVIFEDLPDDFYIMEDPNPMDKTEIPASYVLFSKRKIVPKEYIEVKYGGTYEDALKKYPKHDIIDEMANPMKEKEKAKADEAFYIIKDYYNNKISIEDFEEEFGEDFLPIFEDYVAIDILQKNGKEYVVIEQ